MGISLVAEVMARWAPYVPEAPFKVLVQMAITALDVPKDGKPARLYFGGHEPLIGALPFRPGSKPESRLRAVERAVEHLVAAGAIERTVRARSGRSQGYRLTLGNTPKPVESRKNTRFVAEDIDTPPVDNPAAEDEKPDTSGRAEPDTVCRAEPDTSGRWSPTPVVGPRNNEEQVRRNKEDGGLIFADLSPTARASPPNPKPILRRQYAEIGAERCTEHGLAAGLRPDGKPRCPICRRLKEQAA